MRIKPMTAEERAEIDRHLRQAAGSMAVVLDLLSGRCHAATLDRALWLKDKITAFQLRLADERTEP